MQFTTSYSLLYVAGWWYNSNKKKVKLLLNDGWTNFQYFNRLRMENLIKKDVNNCNLNDIKPEK